MNKKLTEGQPENVKKVMVLMSGGVDSSVAAALLRQRGYQVTGVTMKIWGGDDRSEKARHHGCYGPGEQEDIEDARQVAEVLGIPFRVIDLTREYKSVVLDYFCQEYAAGRTPNPCVICNQRVKFKALVREAADSGLEFDFIASGHYARVEYDAEGGCYLLKKARDSAKDQSYFLSFLSQDQLRQLIFPLGEYTKAEVRKIASDLGLKPADKPDSQNFIDGNYTSIIKTPAVPGPVLDKDGNILGRHRGIHSYTIGQRKGLGIAAGDILYVCAVDPGKNAVIVGNRNNLYRSECEVARLNWIGTDEIDRPADLKVKMRSSHKEADARLTRIDSGRVRVSFKEPQLAIAPGQVAVFYQGDTVIGAGIIV